MCTSLLIFLPLTQFLVAALVPGLGGFSRFFALGRNVFQKAKLPRTPRGALRLELGTFQFLYLERFATCY